VAAELRNHQHAFLHGSRTRFRLLPALVEVSHQRGIDFVSDGQLYVAIRGRVELLMLGHNSDAIIHPNRLFTAFVIHNFS
jgi:hypothetical protein